MKRGSRAVRLLAAGAAAAAALLTGGPAAATPHHSAAVTEDAVTVSVIHVDPSTPVASTTPTPLTFTLDLTNTSTQSFDNITIGAERGTTIGTQEALDSAMTDPQAPDSEDPGLDILQPGQARPSASLAAGASTTVEVHTVSSTVDYNGLCVCHDLIYPIWFTAYATQDGGSSPVGTGLTYVPAFKDPPVPIQVSWVWPLLERPHRLLADDAFTDDALARSVAVGGRLDHLLQSVEDVERDGAVAITLIVDPELLDELVVMTKGYSVTVDGTTTKGTGGTVAAGWLSRFEAVLSLPGVDLALTPYADPDVQALTDERMAWSTSMPSAMQARVDGVLGAHPADTELAWPAGGVLSPHAATAVARTGARSVLLDGGALHHGAPRNAEATTNSANGAPVLVSTKVGDLRAFATPQSVTPYLDAALTGGSSGTSRVAEVVAQVAIAAVIEPTRTHSVLLAPPQGIDPDPATAAATIRSTAVSSWSRPVSALTALQSEPRSRATLTQSTGTGLPASTSDTVRSVSDALPALSSLLDPADAADRLANLPAGVQRLVSASWANARDQQRQASEQLAAQVDSLTDGVTLVVPSHGSYTLGGSDSPLPVTIENRLDTTVSARLVLSAVGGVPGFRADDVGIQTIPPHAKLPLHVPVHVDRAGRIRVQAVLSAPAAKASGGRLALGQPLVLSVRSTALGTIGRLITYIAGGLLALALLIRFVRRRRPTPSAPIQSPVTSGVA